MYNFLAGLHVCCVLMKIYCNVLCESIDQSRARIHEVSMHAWLLVYSHAV